MIQRMVMAAIVASVMLGGCTEDQARPDGYWESHPDQARTHRKECDQNVEIMQAIKTTPPDAMTARERECLYLINEWEDPEKRELGSMVDEDYKDVVPEKGNK